MSETENSIGTIYIITLQLQKITSLGDHVT